MPRRLPWALLLACAIAPAQTLSNTQPLAFGAFTAGSGGSVTVAPGGGRMAGGGVILVTQAGTPGAAEFTVSGTPDAMFSISLPADGTVTLSDGASASMALNGFTSSPPATGVLTGGTAAIRVGATLSVGSLQGTGSYSGSFNVTVNYE